MVTALQTMLSRRIDAFEPAVITVGTFHAGTRRNIIPDDAIFEATVRTFNPAVQEQIAAYAQQLCEGIAAGYGLRAEVRYEREYPVTINDAAEHEFVAAAAREIFGTERFVELPTPVTGSEDFSRVLSRVPGAYLFLGACVTGDPVTAPTNHSPRAAFDDGLIADAAALLAELAVRRLAVARTRKGA
jgi:hippurate hydrolase